MTEQTYSVFVDASTGWKGFTCRQGVNTLEGMIAAALEPVDGWCSEFTPVAWMVGHATNCAKDRAESIAAGRTIDLEGTRAEEVAKHHGNVKHWTAQFDAKAAPSLPVKEQA